MLNYIMFVATIFYLTYCIISSCMSYINVYFLRYKRLFAIGTKGITTYNPSSLEVTNQVKKFAHNFLKFDSIFEDIEQLIKIIFTFSLGFCS